MVLTMAHFIDKGLKGPDEPIFREGIGIVSVRKPAPRPEHPTSRSRQKPLLKAFLKASCLFHASIRALGHVRR